jgi:ABC-2 type transport system ATP-binding protein
MSDSKHRRPPPEPGFPVEGSSIGRRYGDRWALADVDLRVEPGQIVGLVGPNGSGKTTLLKILAGFLRPTRGTVAVFGRDPFREQARVMETVRFAFAPPALFDTLTPLEHLHHLTAIRAGSMCEVTTAEIESVLYTVGLHHRRHDRVRTFSFGMRQRLILALSLLPSPALLVLDEPTDGLDPVAILELRRVLLEVNRTRGITIVLSSHLLVEIEQLVDRLLVLTEGRTLFSGDPRELVDGHRRIRLRARSGARAAECLRAHGLDAVARGDEIELPAESLTLEAASRILEAVGESLLHFYEHQPSLESALLARLQADGSDAGGGRSE